MKPRSHSLLTRVAQGSIALLVSCSVWAQGQKIPGERPFSIEKQAPGLEELIDPAAKLELLSDRYGLTEGPVWVDSADGGYLIFADLIADVIWKWTPKGGTTAFLERAGYTGTDKTKVGTQTMRGRMHVLLIGPNGITLDPQGRVVYCASPDRQIVRLEKDGKRTVLAHKFQGKQFSGPNDLVFRSDGTLYFTDTIWGLREASMTRKSPYQELDFNGIFMVKNGEATLLVDDKALGGMPNGLAFSPDEKTLYANGGDARIMSYDVKPDGTLANGKVFYNGDGSDGIKVDVKGNVYTTNGAGPGEVRITSPKGVRIGTLKLPIINKEPRPQICATNVAFGDKDSKGLYITACEAVYRVQMKVAGVRPKAGS